MLQFLLYAVFKKNSSCVQYKGRLSTRLLLNVSEQDKQEIDWYLFLNEDR